MQIIGARRLIDPLPIYTMWLREMKRFLRVKARVVGSLLMPLFFLAFLGLPMSLMPAREIPGLEGVGYLDFLAPVIVGISVDMGVTLSGVPGFLLAILIMILTCAAFTGFGLIIATKLGNLEGFMAIMNLIVFPIFFLSGALFPIRSMPPWLRYVMYIDPLTYGVDGLRATLIGVSVAAFPLWLDFAVLLILCVALATLGSYF